jgi:hypothetical protein
VFKYCTKCDTYFHRDILGAENIIHAGKSVFLTEKKPDYPPKWRKPQEKKNGNDSDNIQEIKDPLIKKIKFNLSNGVGSSSNSSSSISNNN